MEFSRQEYWNGLLFPSPGIFLTQGSNLGLPHCRQALYHSNGRNWTGTKEPLDKDEGGEWKNWLKTKYLKKKNYDSGPITSWPIEGEKVEVVTDFLLLGSKITGDGDGSHDIRRWLLLVRKLMTNLDSVLKSTDITLPKIVHMVKAMVFQWSRPIVRAGP